MGFFDSIFLTKNKKVTIIGVYGSFTFRSKTFMSWFFPHTSESLQKQYSETYQDFFAKSDVVLSGQFNFNWFPTAIGKRSHYIFIKSKLPLKVYVWFKKSEEKTQINNCTYFSLNNNSFCTEKYKKFNKFLSEVQQHIEDWLLENNIEENYEINILSEAARWHWIGFTGSIFATLSMWLHILAEKVTSDLEEFKENYVNLYEENDFDAVSYLGRQLEYITKHHNSWWENVYSTISPYKWPNICLAKNFDNDTETKKLQKKNSKIMRLQDLSPGENLLDSLPLEYFLVYSWQLNNTDSIESMKNADKNQFEKYKDFYLKELVSDKSDNDYLQNLLEEKDTYQQIADWLSILSISNIYYLNKLIKLGDKEWGINNYIDNLNNARKLASILEDQGWFIEDLKFEINKTIWDQKEIWIIPIYSWRVGGNYLIVTPEFKYRNNIEDSLESLKQNKYPNIHTQHISWRDEFTGQWIKIEQFISKDTYSKFIKKGMVVYTNNQWTKEIWEYSAFIKKFNKWILLDETSNKVYLNGVKLTKKDIKSQTTTVEVISKLLDSLWYVVHNTEYPPSTYTRQQNQMIGKIIGPLRKLIKKNFNEECPITCTWSLRDFNLKFEKWSDVTIWKISTVN